jgi:hypothetical protein
MIFTGIRWTVFMKLPVAFGSSAKLEPVLPWKLSVAAQLLVAERVDSNADVGLVWHRRTDNSVRPGCTKSRTCTVLLATLPDDVGIRV